MRMLVRKDPFLREMAAWRNAMDRTLEETTEQPYWNRTGSWALALDVAETDEFFLVKASIPGINPNDLEITLTDNVLTLKGEIEENNEIEEGQWHLQERRVGSFQRSITLSTPVDANGIDANYVGGVLTLNVPKVAEVKPKRIEVKVN